MAVPSDLAGRIPEPSSPPSLKPCCPAPSFTSFYRLILATCFSSCSLSPRSLSISLWKGHLADIHSALFTPLLPPIPRPHISSSFTCVSGRLSLVRRGRFSQWAQTEGLFQLCLHRDLPFSQNWPGWMMCLWSNRCPHKVWISADMIHHIY